MVEADFRTELAGIRLGCEKLLTQELTVEQLAGLGAELHAHTQLIIDHLQSLRIGWQPGF